MIKLCAFSDEASESLKGQIEALKRNCISMTELRSIDGVNVKDITVESAQIYALTLKDNGIKVWSIGSPLGKIDINSDFSEYEKTIRHICDLARVFDCDKIRIFSFFNAYDKKEEVFKRLTKMVGIAKEYGISLYHENEKEVYGDTLERVKELKSNVVGLNFVFDPANYVQVGENATEALNELYAGTTYFHIKDVIKSTDELVPAGEGDAGINEIILKIDGDKVLTLEPHLALFAGYSSIDHTEMKNKYAFKSNDESFDFAANALKRMLKENGYYETKEGYIKK